MSLEIWKCGSYGQSALVFLPINPDCGSYGFGWGGGEKIGGSDVVATVMGEEWLR